LCGSLKTKQWERQYECLRGFPRARTPAEESVLDPVAWLPRTHRRLGATHKFNKGRLFWRRLKMDRQANSVSAQIVPEVRGEIIQAVNSLRSSPAVAVSPDSIINRISDQGTCIPISSNNQPISPVISINDQLGLNVSQQLREKIVNGEYVDLGALLANSAQDQPSCFTINTNGQFQVQPKASKKISDKHVA